MIDEQFGRVDRGERIAGLPQRPVEVELLLDDLVARQRIARLDLERGPKALVIDRLIELAEIDRSEAVTRPRHDIEADVRSLRRLLASRADTADGADHLRIVVAVDAQQLGQQRLVLARTRGELRDVVVGIAVLQFLNRGERFEALGELAAHGEAFLVRGEAERELRPQRDHLAGGHGAELVLLLVEIGELDAFVARQPLGFGNVHLVGPGDGDGDVLVERRIGCKVRRLLGKLARFGLHALFGPPFGIFDRRIGDQVFEAGAGVLRQHRLRRDRQRDGERGCEVISADDTGARSRLWPAGRRCRRRACGRRPQR